MNKFEKFLFVVLIIGQGVLAYQINLIDSNAEREIRALNDKVVLIAKGLMEVKQGSFR